MSEQGYYISPREVQALRKRIEELDKKCVWKPIDGMRKFKTSCGTQSNTAYATRYCHNCGGRVEEKQE